jgi:predicted TIM-barrel fold metal-dependent hydrolase
VEVALCNGWNRWLADIWRQGQGRLRWSCVLPLLSLPDALDQMRFSKEHGACAVYMPAIAGDRLLVDSYHYPIFEEASRLDLAIAVHIGNLNPWFMELYRQDRFPTLRATTVSSMHDLLMSQILVDFPKLRFGFIEASAQWLPWILKEARTRYQQRGRIWPDNVMQEFRLYVTCENSDDLPYILAQAGEDCLVMGTDFGHHDPASDDDALIVLKQRSDISDTAKQKILTDNPGRLYGLSESQSPL